jgi:uncharacterized protein YneF (UPF0154 family)
MLSGDVVVHKIEIGLWFVISLLVGMILGSLIIMSYEQASFKPWGWEHPPIILNCYKKDLSELYIVDAVHYWTLKGHNFAYIENNPSEHICKADHIQGFIMIKKKNLDHNTLGLTQRRVFMGNIVAANVYFDSGTFKITNVFEHELGHALGYNHVEEDGHIMHPIWDKMTPKFWIPE